MTVHSRLSLISRLKSRKKRRHERKQEWRGGGRGRRYTRGTYLRRGIGGVVTREENLSGVGMEGGLRSNGS